MSIRDRINQDVSDAFSRNGIIEGQSITVEALKRAVQEAIFESLQAERRMAQSEAGRHVEKPRPKIT